MLPRSITGMALGYGPDAVVIYRSDGSVVKQFALKDIVTENDIGTLPTTNRRAKVGLSTSGEFA